jgi:hypothetical protein
MPIAKWLLISQFILRSHSNCPIPIHCLFAYANGRLLFMVPRINCIEVDLPAKKGSSIYVIYLSLHLSLKFILI